MKRLALFLPGLLFAVGAQGQTTVAGFTPGSFRVTDSGAAEYRIPIQVPPGIAGMEPRLALVYNSQAGNGLLGVGWTLEGLSVITRCPRTVAQDGVRGGINYDWNDRYCLDGQRLMVISESYGAHGAEYRTERESFTKVISYGTAGNGPAWFKVWMKSGQIVEYGNTADSRIEAQGKSSVRVWAANKVSDTKGNDLAVVYTEDSANGDYYPARIDFAGNRAVGPATSSSLRLEYQARPDVMTRYIGGSVVRTVNRLAFVKTYTGDNPVREYRVSYEAGPATGRSRAASIAECTVLGCLPATTVTWRADSAGINVSNDAVPVWWDDWRNLYQIHVGDFNGDGVGDIWMTGFNGAFFCAGPGIAVANNCTQVWWDDWRSLYQIHVGDFNGDGISDIWMTGFNGAFFCAGPGIASANNCAQVWWDDWRNLYQIHVGDFNGDGISDIWMTGFNGAFFCAGPGIAAANNCTQVWWDDWRNLYQIHVGDFNGDGISDIWMTGFNGAFFCTGPGIAAANNCTQVWWDDWRNLYQIHVGDFNGDGISDIWMTGFNGAFFCAGPGIAAANNCTQVWWDDWRKLYQIHVGDFNGDGISDIWMTGFNGGYFCGGPGIASGWNCAQVWWDDWRSLYQIHVGDFNGDGVSDIWMTGFNGAFFAAGGSKPDLVAVVTSGLGGAASSITYRPATDPAVHTKEGGGSYPVVNVPAPLDVAFSHTASDGVGGTSLSTYRYGGLKFEVGTGRGLLGFAWMESTQPSSGLKVRSEFRQDWPFVGLTSSMNKTQGFGGPLSQVSNTYSCTNPATGAACTLAAGNRYFPFLSQSVQTGSDLNGAALPAVTSRAQYDAYGNAISVVVSTGDGYSKTTANIYTNDTASWSLGRLGRSTVQSTAP